MTIKPIRFSQHALEKFDLLAAHGFVIDQSVVIDAVVLPDFVVLDQHPPIAQKAISPHTVLRVVFVENEDEYFIITFYPGKRKRYEDNLQP